MNDLDIKESDMEVLFSEDELKKGIKRVAEDIDKIIPADETLYVICVLKGSIMFFSELVKNFKRPIKLEFVRISSYGNEMKSTQNLQAIDLPLPDLNGENVLIAEDIIDTGLTAKFITDLFKTKYQPKKVIFAALLNKKCARQIDIEPDVYGFEIDNKFVIGYGLDYKGYYRNLPYIGYVPQ